MRLKCVKGAKEKVENSPYIVLEPEKYRGEYNKLFKNNNPIHIEIGMGKGDFIIESALRYPNINFIGIEKYDSVIVRAIQKLENIKIDNLKLIRIDAIKIEEIFNNEIDTIYLNFSDPWPKIRHERRRLTSPFFLERYNKILRRNAHIIQKTDNRNLFEFSIKSFNSFGYKIEDISLDLYEDDISDNIPTEYELKFVRQNKIIYKIDVKR